MSNATSSRVAVGIMTGTSLDAVDACGIQVQGHGLAMTVDYLASASTSLESLAEPLRALAEDIPMPASEIAQLRRALGELCGEAISSLELDAIDLIATHGQTSLPCTNTSDSILNHRFAATNNKFVVYTLYLIRNSLELSALNVLCALALVCSKH